VAAGDLKRNLGAVGDYPRQQKRNAVKQPKRMSATGG